MQLKGIRMHCGFNSEFLVKLVKRKEKNWNSSSLGATKVWV